MTDNEVRLRRGTMPPLTPLDCARAAEELAMVREATRASGFPDDAALIQHVHVVAVQKCRDNWYAERAAVST